MGLIDLCIERPEKIIEVPLNKKFKNFFLHEKCKNIIVIGLMGFGKTVTNKKLCEYHIDNWDDCIIISIDEKNEYYPFIPQTRDDMIEILEKNWNTTPKGYKTFMLIPYVGKSMPKELPKIGWYKEGEGCYTDYFVIDEQDLTYIDRLALITPQKGKFKPAVAEWIREAEIYLKNRDLPTTKQNIYDVLMNDDNNLTRSEKRSIKHTLIEIKDEGVTGTKKTLNMKEILEFCNKNDIRWVNVCQYFFGAGKLLPRIVFIKHLLQQVYDLKRHKELDKKVIISIPELHTYLSRVGYRDKYIARDIFTDMLSKGRALAIKFLADTQLLSIIPPQHIDYFDTHIGHNLGSSREYLFYARYVLGLNTKEELRHSEKLYLWNILTDKWKFPKSEYGAYHLKIIFNVLKTGDFFIKDYRNKLWYLDKLLFPPCRQFHEDRDLEPFKDHKIKAEKIHDLFMDEEIDYMKYEILKIEGEGDR